ncbi:MAG: phosphate signaling complex protein PhoU, partial [Gammaproteobacteria bacterium]|nr:phosphate signaling complex protein PhoU [Gammaproteobacteria bacterium]
MPDKSNDAHIVQRFDRELEGVRSDVLAMGGIVEQQLNDALQAMSDCDAELAERTATNDYKVNRMEVQIDETCTRILALRQPTASDLRLVLTVAKIIADLERIGDEAERIALFVTRIARSNCNRRHYTELLHMGALVKDMLHNALDAFARMDPRQAVEVARMDEKVDAEYEAHMRQTMTY